MTNLLNGHFWRFVAGVEALVISTLFVYGILRIQAIEVQAAAQVERNGSFEEKLNKMENTLEKIKDGQDRLLMSVVQPHLVARP